MSTNRYGLDLSIVECPDKWQVWVWADSAGLRILDCKSEADAVKTCALLMQRVTKGVKG